MVPSTSGDGDRHSVYSSPGSKEPELSRRSSSPIVRVEVDYSNRLEVVWGEFAGPFGKSVRLVVGESSSQNTGCLPVCLVGLG